MLHYFGVFVWALFPLALFMLALIMLPLPAVVRQPAQSLVDAILGLSVHANGIRITLFHAVVFVAGLTFMCTLHGSVGGRGRHPLALSAFKTSSRLATAVLEHGPQAGGSFTERTSVCFVRLFSSLSAASYNSHTRAQAWYDRSGAGDRNANLIAKWHSERDLWISGFALTLYMCVGRGALAWCFRLTCAVSSTLTVCAWRFPSATLIIIALSFPMPSLCSASFTVCERCSERPPQPPPLPRDLTRTECGTSRTAPTHTAPCLPSGVRMHVYYITSCRGNLD
jgi:hypothetical protein